MTALESFLEAVKVGRPRVLELGTKRWNPDRPTHHKVWAPNASEFMMTDIEPGIDVDFVCDAHRLAGELGPKSFDAIISCSTFEHFRQPWVVAREIYEVLGTGGVVFVQTHQSFPLHGYPQDFYRFSREALHTLFADSGRWDTLETDYEFPCSVWSERDPSTRHGEAYLNVCLFGRAA
jgi:SAM-dependent methyltransferase